MEKFSPHKAIKKVFEAFTDETLSVDEIIHCISQDHPKATCNSIRAALSLETKDGFLERPKRGFYKKSASGPRLTTRKEKTLKVKKTLSLKPSTPKPAQRVLFSATEAPYYRVDVSFLVKRDIPSVRGLLEDICDNFKELISASILNCKVATEGVDFKKVEILQIIKEK